MLVFRCPHSPIGLPIATTQTYIKGTCCCRCTLVISQRPYSRVCEMSTDYASVPAVRVLRDYLRIRSVQPDVDYGNSAAGPVIKFPTSVGSIVRFCLIAVKQITTLYSNSTVIVLIISKFIKL